MKHSQKYQLYLWFINTLKEYGGLTLEELKRKWVEDKVDGGNPLIRSSFYRHRDAILDMFGIVIECEPKTYKHYIANPEVLNDDSIERWMFSTMTVHGVLADSASVKERVVLESVPAGEEFLALIISAIRKSRRLRMGYKKFHAEGYEKTVCPYALKLFHQRWYLLAKTEADEMRIYALDRVTKLDMTEETFMMPENFSAQQYFAEYYGVLTDDTPLTRVVVRAHKWMPDYLRTLPLHHSQRELRSTADYCDFSFEVRPTSDFLGELLKYGNGVEVLEPLNIREKMRQMIAETLKRY